jgi:hypothetical protein
MNNWKRFLPWALAILFFGFGITAFLESKPSSKNEHIYTFVKNYSPYYLDKRFGGIQIKSKEDPDFKETPSNTMLFKQLESLEKAWGQKHLKITGDALTVLDNNGSTIGSIPLTTEEEHSFIDSYYGIR